MLIRSSFCPGELRKVQMKKKLCSADLLDSGCRYYMMLWSKVHRPLPQSPEMKTVCTEVMIALYSSVFPYKMGTQTAPSLLWGLKELIPSNCFEQYLTFLNTGMNLHILLKYSLIFLLFFFSYFFFFFFLATPTAYGSFQARDWIQAASQTTYAATAVALPDPSIHCTELGIKPTPPQWPEPL